MSSYCRSFATLSAHQKSTVGDTKTSVIPNDHLGWLICDGRALETKDFYLLWRVIGYSFGGNNSNIFNLPNAAGRVAGIVGSNADDNGTISTFTLGQPVGEYAHRLTIGELATHNHGVAPGEQIGTNSNTTSNVAGITPLTHNHSYNDACFLENGGTPPTVQGSGDGDLDNGFQWRTADNEVSNTPQDIPTSNVTLTDPGHFHSINPAGSNLYHNNVQPTLPIGNMFIYSGRPTYPTQLTNGTSGENGWPYTINTRIY